MHDAEHSHPLEAALFWLTMWLMSQAYPDTISSKMPARQRRGLIAGLEILMNAPDGPPPAAADFE